LRHVIHFLSEVAIRAPAVDMEPALEAKVTEHVVE
jgi:hypothetical protein